MGNNKFFVVVGATGSGKDTLLESLKRHYGSDGRDVPCDSTGSDRGTTSFTQIDISDCHSDDPMETLISVWNRIHRRIKYDVKPALAAGHRVIMKNLGGTAFAEAMVRARSDEERYRITNMHKAFIENCVLGMGLTPPIYLWLRVSPETALRRRRAEKTLPKDVQDPLRYIEETNRYYDIYGTIPGQTVVKIDADKPIEVVFEIARSIIDGVVLQAAA